MTLRKKKVYMGFTHHLNRETYKTAMQTVWSTQIKVKQEHWRSCFPAGSSHMPQRGRQGAAFWIRPSAHRFGTLLWYAILTGPMAGCRRASPHCMVSCPQLQTSLGQAASPWVPLGTCDTFFPLPILRTRTGLSYSSCMPWEEGRGQPTPPKTAPALCFVPTKHHDVEIVL